MDEVIRLGTKYAVVTPWTSGLVVEAGRASSGTPIFYTSKGHGPRGPTTPGEAIGYSRTLRSLKRDGRFHGSSDRRLVEGKRFFWDDRRGWVDEEWTAQLKVITVVAFGDEYFALLRKHPQLAPWLAIADSVTIVRDDVAYVISPRAEPSPSPAGRSPAK